MTLVTLRQTLQDRPEGQFTKGFMIPKIIGIAGKLPAVPLFLFGRNAVGTNGFIWRLDNRKIFRDQMNIVIDVLHPTGIIVYGQSYDYVFQTAIDANIPIYQYDSHTIKRNAEVKSNRMLEGDRHEG